MSVTIDSRTFGIGIATLLGGEKLGYGVKEALSKGAETTGDVSAIQTAKELGSPGRTGWTLRIV